MAGYFFTLSLCVVFALHSRQFIEQSYRNMSGLNSRTLELAHLSVPANSHGRCTCTSKIFTRNFHFLPQRVLSVKNRQFLHASVLYKGAFDESVICFISDKELLKFHEILIATTLCLKKAEM